MGSTQGHRKGRRPRPTLITTQRLQDQRGASLVIALVLILVLGVTLSAVLAFVTTNFRASNIYRQQREERYAGDAAIEAAINYVRSKPTMGRDPNYAASDPPCVYNVPTDEGVVAVTCAAEPGSGSGVPVETGLVPDQAILALGQRHTEVGPLNQTDCENPFGWVPFVDDAVHNAQVEDSILFRQGEVRGYFEEASLEPCANRNRDMDNFRVRGKVVAAGRVSGSGSVTLEPVTTGATSTPSRLYAQHGCAIAVNPAGCLSSGASFADPGNNGTTLAWQHVPINWTVRTGGFFWNGSALVGGATCAPKRTIILLPGYYPNVNDINKYTASTACRESTIWLAPNPGADNVLLTDDDKTGAFYFGFTNTGTSYPCSDLTANAHRLCIGGNAANNSPRVVAGTPLGWNPLGVPGADPQPRVVTLSQANTVDNALSQSWSNAANAKTINGAVATYTPTACLFGICLSSDRAIRLRDFSPNVAAGPDPGQGINIQVAHRTTGTLNQPQVQVRTVSNESGSKTCPGDYRLPVNNSSTLRTDSLLLNGSTSAAATALAQCLDGADLINGVQLTMYWRGNEFNSGSPRVYLDGARISFTSTPGASFPLPATGTGGDPVADCDDTKAGAQLIFGGDSHAYVADGSLEVCAGPYPTSPGDHQQIAVYGVPAVPPLTGRTDQNVSISGSNGTLTNGNNARDIAEVPRRDARVNFSSNNTCNPTYVYIWPFGNVNIGTYCAVTWDYSTTVSVPIQPFPTASYPNLDVDRVTARVTYDADNAKALEFIETDDPTACRAWVIAKLAGTLGIGDLAGNVNCARSAFRIGSCTFNAPLAGDLRSWDIDVTGCVSQSDLVNGVTAQWIARSQHVKFCFIGCIGEWGKTSNHTLDGIEILVGLKQRSGSPNTVVPQSGCIVDYPNYWEGVAATSTTPPNNIYAGGDCAIIKADSLRPTNSWVPDWIVAEGADYIGRVSLQGTLYAPSAAFEIDELDSAYSLASRGLVVRHLRVKGWQRRPGYEGTPIIDTQLDTTPKPREANFVACIRGPGRASATTACSKADGDRILTTARVRFETPQDLDSNGSYETWQPVVVWWNDQR